MSTPSPGKGQGQTSHNVDRLDNQGTHIPRRKTGTSGIGYLTKPKAKTRDQDRFAKKLLQDSAKPESLKPSMSTPIQGKGRQADRLDNQSSQIRRYTSEASGLGPLKKNLSKRRDQDKFNRKLSQDSAKPDCVMTLVSTASQTITPGSLWNKVEPTIDNHSSSQFCQSISETLDDEPLKPTRSTPSPGKGQGQTSYKVDWIDNQSSQIRRSKSETSGSGVSKITFLTKSKKRDEDQLDKKLLPDSAKPSYSSTEPSQTSDMEYKPEFPPVKEFYKKETKQVITTSKGDGLTSPILYKSNELNKRGLYKMCIKYQRTSPEVTYACEHVRMQILACSKSFKDVWSTFKPKDPDNIVFVVFCEPGSDRHVKLPNSVKDFDIAFRTIGEYNNEDKEFPKEQQLFSKSEHTDQNNLTDILRKTSSLLMKNHSNLNIMTASPVKSESHSFKRKPCIVFYVHVKGYIPHEEEEFPRTIGSYETDVREGAFALYNDPENRAQRLKIGCSIGEDTSYAFFGGSGGTLGAFVDLGPGNVGCITSAHVLVNEYQLRFWKNNNKIERFSAPSTIYQPAPSQVPITDDSQPFGRIESAVYRTGRNGETGVEAALVTITVPNRHPEDGRFPKVPEDFTADNQLNYMSGHILHAIPENISQYTFYKYGATTELTRGAFNLHASAVRTNGKLDVWGNCELHNQIEVVSCGSEPFAKPGDSGALVLLSRDNDLYALGIVTGGTLDFTKFYVTPIWEVLKALGLPSQLKNFHVHFPMDTDNDSNDNASLFSEIGVLKLHVDEIKSNSDNMQTKVENVEKKVDMIDSGMRAGFDEILKQMNVQK